MLARGLERALGSKNARPQARALLVADPHAFAGYARWQINERWDVFAGEESLKPYLAEVKFFERMRAFTYDWPPALSSSLGFRFYLAQRDVFVRQAARGVFGLRRLLNRGDQKAFDLKVSQMVLAGGAFAHACKQGLHSARAMWRRTRLATRGQNEMIVEADKRRLTAWLGWLRRLARRRDLVNGPNPICGSWQLNLRVHNFAPAVQKILVEQRKADGVWEELVGRYAIEFRAHAARAKTKLWRELSVPVANPDAVLRIRVGGVGQVQLSHTTLTNGTIQKRLQASSQRKRLGRRAPTQGFPEMASTDDKASVWELPGA
jgi:hypothetical protein